MNRIRLHEIIRYATAIMATGLLLLPCVLRTRDVPSMQDTVCFGVIAALCSLALCAVLVVGIARHLVLRWHWMDAVAGGWWLWMAANYWLLSPFPAVLEVHEATALFWAYAALRVIVPLCSGMFRRVWLVGLWLTGSYEAVVGLCQLFGLSHSYHAWYAITGTFFNSGPYSIFVALTLSTTIAVAFRSEINGAKGVTGAAWVVMALCLLALVGTWSRTAWLAIVIVATVFFWKQGYRRTVGIGSVILICVGIAAYFLKQDSADGRVLMTLVSVQAWLDKWLVGYGVGSFAHVYGEAQADFFTANPDSPLAVVAGSPEYAFNALLGIGMEQGSIGMILTLTLSLWSLCTLLRQGDVSAYGWLALLMASMFSYPFTLWPFRLLAVGWTAIAVSGQAGTRAARWWQPTLVALSLGVAVWISVSLYHRTVRRVTIYEEYSRLRGTQDMAFVDDFRHMMDALDDCPDYLFTYGMALRDLGRYNDSNAVLRQGTLVSCDPMFYIIMGNNYRDLGAVAEAEAAYCKAFNLLPYRIYPLYRLMKLYEETGQETRARRAAHRVANFPVKVDSPAVRQMKEEARQRLATPLE